MSAQPETELDPIQRLHVLAAAIPGAAVAEGVLDAPFDAVWDTVGDLEHAAGIEIFVGEPRIRSRRADPKTGGERLELEYRIRPFRRREVTEVDLRRGWCWMQSPSTIAAMAAMPEGDRTRFAHLEAARFPVRRLFKPLLLAKMALVRELRRFEQQAQARAAQSD